MHKFLSLVVSVSLLLSSMAPAYAAGSSSSKKSGKSASSSSKSKTSKSGKSAGSSSKPKTLATQEMDKEDASFVERMFSNCEDTSLWGNAQNVNRLSDLLNADPKLKAGLIKDFPKNVRNCLLTVQDECKKKLQEERTGKYPALCTAQVNVTRILKPGVASTIYAFNSQTHRWEKTTSGKKGKSNPTEQVQAPITSDGLASRGTGPSTERIQETLDGKKPVYLSSDNTLGKVAALELRNAEIPITASTGEPVSKDVSRFITLLNRANRAKADLESVMAEAMKAFLSDQYSSYHDKDFPPSYLSLLFKVYMDRISNFGHAWHYVTYGMPREGEIPATREEKELCEKNRTKCVLARYYAVQALLLQPRFRGNLTTGQREMINNIIQERAVVGQNNFLLFAEILGINITIEGKRATDKIKNLFSQEVSKGKSEEEAYTSVIKNVALEAFSPVVVVGAAKGEMVKYEVASFASRVGPMAANLVKTALGTVSAEVSVAAAPVTLTALFVGGFIFALDDAYAASYPSASAEISGLIVEETYKALQAMRMDAAQEKVQDRVQEVVETRSCADVAKGRETCEFRVGTTDHPVWTLNDLGEKINYGDDASLAQKKNLMLCLKDAGVCRNVPENRNYLTSSSVFARNCDHVEKQLSTVAKMAPMCASQLKELEEVGRVSRSFISSTTRRGIPFVRAVYRGGHWIAQAEVDIQKGSDEWFKIAAQWVIDGFDVHKIINNLMNKIQFRENLGGNMGWIRFEGHEVDPEKSSDKKSLHVHYEEFKQYKDGEHSSMYLCNHTFLFMPDDLKKQFPADRSVCK